MQLRRSLIATGAVAVLAVSGVTAAVANDPPPRIAFLANGIVPADALAAGPIAGQLGAPIYTTGPGALIESTGVALDAYDPDLVIVMGGPAAISDAVLTQVADVTDLSIEEASPPPTSGIVRAAGDDRFETAAAAAALLGSYDPAFLPTDMQAADSDKLDGKDSTEFASSSALPELWLKQASSGGAITENNAQEELVDITVTVPGDGYVNVEGLVYMLQRADGDPAVNLRLWLDGELLVNSSVDLADTNGNPRAASFMAPAVFPVEAGQTYTVSMTAIAFKTLDLDIAYSQQQLKAEFWPDGQATVVTP